jgi:WD40 repeat protein
MRCALRSLSRARLPSPPAASVTSRHVAAPRTQVLEGHTDEIFSAAFNYEGDTIITGSKDNTCRIWKC